MGHLGVREAELRGFLCRVGEAFPLQQAILFGSRVRGDELYESDYDLVLVSPRFEGMRFIDRIYEVLKLWDGDVGLEILCYTPEEFRCKSQEICIVSEALAEGKELLEPAIPPPSEREG